MCKPYVVVAIVTSMVLTFPARAQKQGQINAPATLEDPTIWDGAATSYDEWSFAHRYPNCFVAEGYSNGGYFYVQNKENWAATSSSANTDTFPGVVFFIAHDIWGQPDGPLSEFRSQDMDDWNYMKFPYQGAVVECWVLANGDTLDDTGWLPYTGLGNSGLIPEGGGNNLIIDRGFIVRANEDPLTDVHWYPGDPEPGDPAWDWADYHGVFAGSGFNSSFFDIGLDSDPAHSDPNEVYEWAVMGGPELIIPPIQPCWFPIVEWELVDPKHYEARIVGWYFAWWLHIRPPGWVSRPVEVLPPQTGGGGEPGDTVELNVFVANRSDVPDTFELSFEDTRGWPMDPSDIIVFLNDRSDTIVTCELSIPPAADPSLDTIWVEAVSSSDSMARDSAFMIVRALPAGTDFYVDFDNGFSDDVLWESYQGTVSWDFTVDDTLLAKHHGYGFYMSANSSEYDYMMETVLETDTIDCTSSDTVILNYWSDYQDEEGSNADSGFVEISLDGGYSWPPYLRAAVYCGADSTGTESIDIGGMVSGEPNVRVRFRYKGYGNEHWSIDDIQLGPTAWSPVHDICGDANGDGGVTPADGYYILNYFGSGPQPVSCFAANSNGDGNLTPGDGYYILNYFGSGPDLNCAACNF
jgi:hypothetical protein